MQLCKLVEKSIQGYCLWLQCQSWSHQRSLGETWAWSGRWLHSKTNWDPGGQTGPVCVSHCSQPQWVRWLVGCSLPRGTAQAQSMHGALHWWDRLVHQWQCANLQQCQDPMPIFRALGWLLLRTSLHILHHFYCVQPLTREIQGREFWET